MARNHSQQRIDLSRGCTTRNVLCDKFQQIGPHAIDVADFLDGEAGDARPPTRRHIDHAFLLQQHQRFPDRRPAGPVVSREFDGIKIVAGLADPLDDFGRNFTGDPGDQRGPIVPLGYQPAGDGLGTQTRLLQRHALASRAHRTRCDGDQLLQGTSDATGDRT